MTLVFMNKYTVNFYYNKNWGCPPKGLLPTLWISTLHSGNTKFFYFYRFCMVIKLNKNLVDNFIEQGE